MRLKDLKSKYCEAIADSLYIDKVLFDLGLYDTPIYIIDVVFEDSDLNEMIAYCNDLYDKRYESDEAYERFDEWSEFGNFLMEYQKQSERQ